MNYIYKITSLLILLCFSCTIFAQTDNIIRKRSQKESVILKSSEAKPQQKAAITKKSSVPKKKYTPRSTDNSLMQGYASVETEDGHYEGNFVDGQFSGQGTYIFEGGMKIKGNFANGSPNGECEIIMSDGKLYYKGMMKDGNIEGHGIIAVSDSVYAEGEWTDDGNTGTNVAVKDLDGNNIFYGNVKNGKYADGLVYQDYDVSMGYFDEQGNWKHQSYARKFEDYGDKLTFVIWGVPFNMIKVSKGTFTMGQTKEMKQKYFSSIRCDTPAHKVTLTKDYYIAETEVTQELYQAVMGNNPSKVKGPKHPVENVSQNDCNDFAKKLSEIIQFQVKLPTEAQWEYAARGGNKTKHFRYPGSKTIQDVAWMDFNSGKMHHEVATKMPNELGIYDMVGNVSEWCRDNLSDYTPEDKFDPIGSTDGGRFRGGGYSISDYTISERQVAWAANSKFDGVGFRIVIEP